MKRAAIALAIVVLVAAGVWWVRRTPAFTIQPNADRNILLITIDTLRADVVGSYGGRAVTTTLDALASRGARFEQVHAHAVVTLPSHASILTGRYPYEHGIRDNTGYRLDPSQPTAATLLKKQGFATAAFVGGFPLDARFGLNAGFDVYDDHLVGPIDITERERRADAVVAAALAWIDRQRGKWFAWVHLYDPHVLYEPPAEWAQRFPSEPYLGEVSWTDAALKPIVDRLTTQPRRSLVVVTSDHGEGLGDHGETTHGIFAYEPTLRVPLIVAELGGEQRDVRAVTLASPVRHVDLLPTLLESASAPVETGAGTSLLRVINDGDHSDRPMYFEAMTPALTRGWAPLRGVVTGREKYIDLPIPELYDLAGDSMEKNNLAGARPERLRAMQNLLRSYNVAPPARAQAESAETIERLRSLGYVAGSSAAAKEKYTEEDDPKRLIEIEQMLERAGVAFRQGRTDEAIEIYRAVIAKRKDTEDAYRKLALIFWRTGRPRLAIETLESALRNGITQKEVRNRLAQYLAEVGQPHRAIILLEHDADNDPDALIALGNAYLLSGRAADALRTFQQLLTIDPSNALAYENIGVAQLQAKDFKGAELALRRALNLDPSLAGAWTTLGVVLASTGRTDAAIEAWERALQLDPNDANARANLEMTRRKSVR